MQHYMRCAVAQFFAIGWQRLAMHGHGERGFEALGVRVAPEPLRIAEGSLLKGWEPKSFSALSKWQLGMRQLFCASSSSWAAHCFSLLMDVVQVPSVHGTWHAATVGTCTKQKLQCLLGESLGMQNGLI
jgi:hypothetical protein